MNDVPPPTPVWVKVFGAVLLLLLLLAVVIVIWGGGAHGPGRHAPLHLVFPMTGGLFE